jgi:hypothetical protein
MTPKTIMKNLLKELNNYSHDNNSNRNYSKYRVEKSSDVAVFYVTSIYNKDRETIIYDKRIDPSQNMLLFKIKPSEKAEPVFIIKYTHRNAISYHENIHSAINECIGLNLCNDKTYHIEIDWDEKHHSYYCKKWNRRRTQKIKNQQQENTIKAKKAMKEKGKRKRNIDNRNKTQMPRKRGRPKGSKNKNKK